VLLTRWKQTHPAGRSAVDLEIAGRHVDLARVAVLLAVKSPGLGGGTWWTWGEESSLLEAPALVCNQRCGRIRAGQLWALRGGDTGSPNECGARRLTAKYKKGLRDSGEVPSSTAPLRGRFLFYTTVGVIRLGGVVAPACRVRNFDHVAVVSVGWTLCPVAAKQRRGRVTSRFSRRPKSTGSSNGR